MTLEEHIELMNQMAHEWYLENLDKKVAIPQKTSHKQNIHLRRVYMRNYDASKADPTSILWGGLIQMEADEEDYEPEKVIMDSIGDPIDDVDGVFELTFIHNGYCEQTGVFESGETCLIVTQMNIVDAIEEYDAEFLKNIEYIGTGKYYKENEYGR